MSGGWIRVSPIAPCPVCGKHDWCCTSMTTGLVMCMRTPSDHQARGGGWLHGSRTEIQAAQRPAPTPTHPARPTFNAQLWFEATRHVRTEAKLQPWANSLGLPADLMDYLGASVMAGMLCFPMYDGAGSICGIRTRSRSGEKRSITGSRSGVFLPVAPVHLTTDEAPPLICEGPTDSVAAMALGFEPIGRPSCRGCEEQVVETCKRFGYDRVTVCADSDGPGLSGAQSMADKLRFQKIAVRMVTPGGHKDLRDWFKTGVSKDRVNLAWSQAEWR